METDLKNSISDNLENMAVVIIGRNEGARLELCFRSVIDSGVGHYVYVDSMSSDNSVEIAKAQKIPTRVLGMEKPLTAARGRNVGFEMLKKLPKKIDYIHFIDGDCELDKQWLIQAKNTLDADANVAIVRGRLREKHRDATIYTKLCDMAWYVKPGEIKSCGGIATIKASVFDETTGFDESFIAGEEAEFCNRVLKAGHKIICIDTEMGTHDAAITKYSQWRTRSVRTGFAFASAEKWGQGHKRRSLIIWGGLYPLVVFISFFTVPVITLILLSIFPLQVLRLYFKLEMPYAKRDKLLYAFFCMHDKTPEFLGFLKHRRGKKSGTKQGIIEYKTKQ